MAVVDRSSDLADPRLWPNAVQIGEAIARPTSTVRDALANYLRLSRGVGRERHYPWLVVFQLADAYAVPLKEVDRWASHFLEAVAAERGFDPRDLRDLYRAAQREWQSSDTQPDVTPAMVRQLAQAGRVDSDVIAADRAIAESHAAAPAPPLAPKSLPRATWEKARVNSP